MSRITKVRKILVGLFRELSDQAAYTRHLAAHGRDHSKNEWRRFHDERLRAKFARPRCC